MCHENSGLRPILSSYHLACMAGVQRRGKGERRAREAREDRTREDRGRDRVPSPSRAHFDFAPFLRPATQATYHVLWSRHVHR